MKKIEMAKALGLADEKYIAEAAPKANTRGRFWRKFALIAACVSLVVTSACLWLFLPYEKAEAGELDRNDIPAELKAYSDSEYLDLMYAIYEYDKTHYSGAKNNYENYFEDFFDDLFGIFAPRATADADNWATADGAPPVYSEGIPTKGETNGSSYVETTDNQVEGVIEADLFKRTTSHIFYLDMKNMTVRTYSIAGEESRLVSEYKIENFNEDSIKGLVDAQLFLSADGKTLTVIGNAWSENKVEEQYYISTCVLLLSLDVSDPENIKEKDHFAITGSLISARLVDGKILLMTKFAPNYLDDYSEKTYFIPRIDTGDGFEFIPAEDIIFPEELTSKYYTVVAQLDEDTLGFEGAIACLSYSTEVYVSTDKIFLTRRYDDLLEGEDDGVSFVKQANMTEILAIGYGNGSFEKLSQISVEGRVKDQYSLDEYEGILRVVTTTSGTKYSGVKVYVENGALKYDGDVIATNLASNAALYCIDLESRQIVGEVRDFAPAGETVESVRFDGTNAYVCTAVVVTFTDPVYFFDLSDMSNITYTDTGVIEGYSSSLVNFGEGILLGIGYGDSRDTLKIEVYAENGNKVESICSYEKNAGFSEDYKAYFIDRERGLVGLAIYYYDDYRDYKQQYILLAFNGYELIELERVDFDSYVDMDFTRATLADDYFYIMGYDEFKVVKVFD